MAVQTNHQKETSQTRVIESRSSGPLRDIFSPAQRSLIRTAKVVVMGRPIGLSVQTHRCGLSIAHAWPGEATHSTISKALCCR